MPINLGAKKQVNYLEFDGVDDYVPLGTKVDFGLDNNSGGLNNFTIETDFLLNSISNIEFYTLLNFNRSETAVGIRVHIENANNFAVRVRNGTSNQSFNSNFLPNLNQRYRLTITFNNGNLKTFIDGKKILDFNFTHTDFATNSTLEIGLNDIVAGNRRPINGEVSKFELYNTAYSESDVGNKNFNSNDLIAKYNFIGQGTTLPDLIGNNDGTIEGATWGFDLVDNITKIYKGENEIEKVFLGELSPIEFNISVAPPINQRNTGEVWTIEELNNIRNNLSGNYNLMRNLDFENDASYDNPANKNSFTTGAGWNPIANFTGSLEGNGFVIRNLYFNRSVRGGLFGDNCTNATLQNFGLMDVNLTSAERSAILCRGLQNGDINNIFTSGVLNSTGEFEFGAMQSHSRSTIEDTYNLADILNNDRTGGIAGRVDDPIITSYSVGVTQDKGLAGANPTGGGSTTNCYWDVQSSNVTSDAFSATTGLNTNQMKGMAALKNMFGFDFTNKWHFVKAGKKIENTNIVPLKDGYPILRSIDVEAQLIAQDIEAFKGTGSVIFIRRPQ